MSDTNIHCAIKKDESRTQSRNAIGEVPLLLVCDVRSSTYSFCTRFGMPPPDSDNYEREARLRFMVCAINIRSLRDHRREREHIASRHMFVLYCSIPLMFAHQLNILCKCNHKLCCFCGQVTFPGILLRISWSKSRSLRSYPR